MTDSDNASDTFTTGQLSGLALDALSLEQTLLDFEIANARVVDLTKRLVEATEELIQLRHEAEILRSEVAAARGSRAFMLARKVRVLIRLLRQ